jgi:hypothetical protein
LRHERVKVERDQNTKVNRTCPPWEIPVLEFIFEDGNITPLDEFVTVPGEYPEPAKELDRLVRCYGADPQSGVPYANSVFGNGNAGVRALKKAIDEAKAEELAASVEQKPVPAKRGRRPAYEPAAGDSLLS